MSDDTPTWFEVREQVEHNTYFTADEFDRMIEAVRAEEREQADRGPSDAEVEHVAHAILQERLRLRPPGVGGQVVPYVTDDLRSLARTALRAAQEVRND